MLQKALPKRVNILLGQPVFLKPTLSLSCFQHKNLTDNNLQNDNYDEDVDQKSD